MKLAFLQTTEFDHEHYVVNHSHQALEIVYYLQGSGTSSIDGMCHRYAQNTFTITPAGMAHDETHDDAVSTICLGLTHAGLDAYQGCWCDAEACLGSTMQRLLQEMHDQLPGHEDICQGMLWEIRGLIQRLTRNTAKKHSPAVLVERALTHILRNEGQLSVEDLSNHLFVSKSYLRHLFHEYSSQSPMRHIIQVRLARAEALLQQTDMPISKVADACGFDNPYYFSRLFTQVYGQSPTQFRRHNTCSGNQRQ